MLPDTQPDFELPAILRLPQVPPLKVPGRRQTQFMARPAPTPVRYTEQIPVTPSLAPKTESDLFQPMPVTPPLIRRPQTWMRTPYPAYRAGIADTPVRGYAPASRRSREVGNGEFLLGCAFLILVGLLALVLLTWLSAVR